jgi:threonine aldolase
MKQHGALLAKGRMLGIQFDVLFEDGLYRTIGKTALAAADKIRLCLDSKETLIYCRSSQMSCHKIQ